MKRKYDWINFLIGFLACFLVVFFFVKIDKIEVEKQMIASLTPSGYPCKGEIEVSFGLTHTGVDIPAPYGTELVATADGEIIQAGWDGKYGLSITIKHSSIISTRYAHCSRILMHVGNIVKKNQVIAYMGFTGESTHSHVHYEILFNGKPIDPVDFNTNNTK